MLYVLTHTLTDNLIKGGESTAHGFSPSFYTAFQSNGRPDSCPEQGKYSIKGTPLPQPELGDTDTGTQTNVEEESYLYLFGDSKSV